MELAGAAAVGVHEGADAGAHAGAGAGAHAGAFSAWRAGLSLVGEVGGRVRGALPRGARACDVVGAAVDGRAREPGARYAPMSWGVLAPLCAVRGSNRWRQWG